MDKGTREMVEIPSNHKIREPWLAVILSLLWPGIGQFYVGKLWKAIIVSIITIGSFCWGIWSIFSRYGNAKQGWIVFTLSICLYFWNIIDAWRSAKKTNEFDINIERKKKKDPYLAILLTSIIPGLGHIYLKQFRIGIPFLIVSVVLQFIEIEKMVSILIGVLLLSVALFHIFKYLTNHQSVSNTIRILIFVIIFEGFCISSVTEIVTTQWIRVKVLSGNSDLPTLMGGDVVVEDMQRENNMKIGSFIVFSYKGIFQKQNKYLIKRLIGFEGEEICIDSGMVYVNHKKLTGYPFSNLYYSTDSTCLYATKQYPYYVPSDCVFVLGDNSSESFDSRSIGGINKKNIISIAYKIIWPYDRIKTLEP